jgi:hypothetical protein
MRRGRATRFPSPKRRPSAAVLSIRNADAERRLCASERGEGGERSEPGGGACVPVGAGEVPPTPDPSPPCFAWGEGNPAAMPCCAPSRRPGALDAAGAEVGNEGGEDLSEVLRRRRRDKELPRCGWERVGGVAVENLRRLFPKRGRKIG